MKFARLVYPALTVVVMTTVAAAAHAEALIGLTSTNALITFDSASPSNASMPVNITGLLDNEQIIGIDTRPANGALIGLSRNGRLYSLDAGNGAATFLSTLTGATLSGTSFGIDFNPMVDRLRVTSNSGQNLRINVDTGATAVDAALNGGAISLNGSAYSNNVAGALTTTLFGISSQNDTLFIQNPPNNGALTAVGALGVDTAGLVGFDISGLSGLAFVSLSNGNTGKSLFYRIDLAAGFTTEVGAFGYLGNTAIAAPILGITAVPEPGTYALFGAGVLALGAVLRRRRRA